MKSISNSPDTPMKRYLAVASACFLLFTVVAPPLGIAFACINFIFFLVWSVLRKEKTDKHFWKPMILGTFFCNVLLLIYINFVKNALPPENAEAYLETLQSGVQMKMNTAGFFDTLFRNMANGQTMLLPTLLVAPLLNLLGGSYPVYVFLVFNLFLVPFFVVVGLLLRKMSPKSVPLLFLFAPFLTPVLRGSLDSAGLLYISIWMYLIYKKTFRKKATKEAVFLGVLSIMLVLMARAYFYYIIGTFLAVFISTGIRRLYDKTYKCKRMMKNLGIIAGTFFAATGILFFPYLKGVLFEPFSFDAMLFWQNMKAFCAYYGALPLLFCAVGVMGLWRRHFRQFTIFLLVQILVVFILFSGNQPLSPANHYLFAPALFLLAVIGVTSLPKMKKPAQVALYAVFSFTVLYSSLPVSLGFLRGFFTNTPF